MPNWVANRLIITGEASEVSKLVKQVGRAYSQTAYDLLNLTEEEIESTSKFSLWNIIAPTNLAEYHEREKWEQKKEEKAFRDIVRDLEPEKPTISEADLIDKMNEAFANPPQIDFDEIRQQFEIDVAEKNDWYHWNLRNWGTKWDTCDVERVLKGNNKVIYTFNTAWSPPLEALDILARDFPNLSMSVKFVDEGDNFAGEVGWTYGSRAIEQDLVITHGLNEELYGECYACLGDHASDPDYQEIRNRYGCDLENTAGFALDLELGDDN